MTMLHEPIQVSPVRSSGRGILDVAYDLPDNWETGVGFFSVGCTEPEILEPCVIGDSVETRPGDAAIFEPIYVRQSAACATMSKIGSVGMADVRLRSTTEWALGRALAIGAGTTNPALADADLIAAQADVVSAVSCLEQAVGDVGFGVDAVLHGPMRAAAYLASEGLIDDQGMSPSGLRWVISPGYPAGTDGGEDTTVNLWATGPIWAAAGDVIPLTDMTTGRPPVGWRTNLDATFAQRIAMVVFDPCLNLTATFTAPICIGGS